MLKLKAGSESARIKKILDELSSHYRQAKTSLMFENSFQLFVATILSAQTTDEQVNKITRSLFTAVPSVYKLSRMKPSDLEPYLKSCGLYRHKSRYLTEAAKMIVEKHNGQIPDQFEQLIKLPGVGRKTANVIISSAFGKPALAVDTHVYRVSRRLGMADGTTAVVVEGQLKNIIPEEKWSSSHHWLIAHGRALCHARNPFCNRCFLSYLCPYALGERRS